MEEKKQRNKFYSAWAKGIVIALFLTAVACFSVFAMIFGGLMCQGFSWEELTSNYYNEKNYLETQDCGQRMASQVNKVRNALSDGKPFLTKGKLDKTKLVDITRLDAKTSQQNPATTYTVEDLLELKDNGLWDEFQDAIWSADYGIYEEYDEDDEEYYEDGEYDEDDNENDTSPTEDVDISDYTPRFRYLYNYARDFETVLPESGETLAEYARTNPKKVSLFELYQQLSNAIDQLSSYQSAIKMDDKTNVIFMVQNLDNKAVYTNVSEWADGNVDPKSLEDLMEDVPVFVAEREDGKLKDVSDNGTDAGKWIYNYFQNDPVTGKNEKIIVSVDVSFPYSDEISAAYVSYENYAGWGNAGSRHAYQSCCRYPVPAYHYSAKRSGMSGQRSAYHACRSYPCRGDACDLWYGTDRYGRYSGIRADRKRQSYGRLLAYRYNYRGNSWCGGISWSVSQCDPPLESKEAVEIQFLLYHREKL